jgi:hypothetical protein
MLSRKQIFGGERKSEERSFVAALLWMTAWDGAVGGGGRRNCGWTMAYCAKAAAEPPHSQRAVQLSKLTWSSFYKTSHPAEERPFRCQGKQDGAPTFVFLLVARREERRGVLRRCAPLDDGVGRAVAGGVGRRNCGWTMGVLCESGGRASALPKRRTALETYLVELLQNLHPAEERPFRCQGKQDGAPTFVFLLVARRGDRREVPPRAALVRDDSV